MNEKLKLPVGWEEKRLRDIGKCLTGLTYTPNDVTDDSGLLVLRSSNVQGGKLVFDDNVFVQRDVNVKNYSQSGDILICVRNGSRNLIGKNAVITADGAGLPHGAFMMLFRSRHNQYLSHLFSSEMYDKQVHRNLGATINSINSSDFYKFKFVFPPFPEQKAIANILQTWDSAIEKTEALLIAKEKQLSWLVSSCINKSGYEKSQLSNLTSEVSKRNRDSSIERVLSVTNHSGFVLPENQFERRVASANLSNYKIVSKGEYAYNPSRINVGSIARLDNWDIGVLSPMYVVFELDGMKVDSDYFLHWLSSSEARQRIKNSAQGSVRETVGFGDLGAVLIPLPNIGTQKRIAHTLNTAKREIDTLKTLADRYRTQKHGLMQKLLTGKWRVKV